MEDQYRCAKGTARHSDCWCWISAVSYPVSGLKMCMLISRQHVGGNDDERRLLPFCPRWHIPGQPDVWTSRSPLCAIATSAADLCPGDKRYES